MKRTIVAAMVAVLVLGGCAGQQQATKEAAAPGSAPTSAQARTESTPVETDPPAVEETTPPPAEPSIAKVGAAEWFTYEDGLKVQVTKLARFKIGPYAAGGKPGAPGVVVTVTIRNGATQTADLSLTTLNVTYGANGNQAEQVYDANYGDGFTGSVLPGRAKTATFAFAVPKGRQTVDVEVEPGFLDYESVHFEGAVK